MQVSNAQRLGATAVFVLNTRGSRPFRMGGTDYAITIPSFSIDVTTTGVGVNATKRQDAEMVRSVMTERCCHC